VWRAPAGCPTEAEVRAQLEALIGGGVEGWGSIEAKAVVFEPVAVEGSAGLWEATIVIESPSGQRVRELEASTCKALADATAVLVSVALDPLAPQSEPREPDPTAVSTGDPPDAAPEQPTTPTRDRDTSEVRGSFGLRVGVGGGPLPRVGPTLGGRFGVTRGVFRFDLGGQYWFEQEHTSLGPEVGGSFSLWVIEARACGVPSVRNVEFPLCGGGQLGGLWGRGLGVPDPQSSLQLWAALLAAAGIVVRPVPALGLGVEASLTVPLVRPMFVLDDVGTVFQPAAVGFEGVFVVEALFGRAR